MEQKANDLIHRIRSGRVRLNLFLKEGEKGPYIEPSKPVFWYKDESDEIKYSEYLRSGHYLDAAWCYVLAHWFVENWRSNRRLETRPDAMFAIPAGLPADEENLDEAA